MFAAVATRTMAGAKRIVPDDGIDVRRLERRSRIVEASRRWQERQDAYKRKLDLQIEELRRRAEPVVPPSKRDEIISQVAAWHGFTYADIIGPCRQRSLIVARFDAMIAVHFNCTVNGRQMSTTELGRVFRRDHTVIINCFQKRGIKRSRIQHGDRK